MVATGARKKILVTGASGLIGRAITENLITKNVDDIRVQVRNPAQARANVGSIIDFTKIEMENGDLTCLGDRELSQLTRACNVVIHTAGLAHNPNAAYQEYEVANLRATQSLVQAAGRNGVDTFVFFSSSAVYGPGPFESATESTPLNGVTPYAVSKAACEHFFQTVQDIPRIIILRPSLVFGEGDRGNLLSLIKNIKANKYKHIGSGNTGKSIIYSKDIAYAVSLCLDMLPNGLHVFNVANPEPISIKNLTEEIAECLGMPRHISSVSSSIFKIGVKAAEIFLRNKTPITSDQVSKLTTTTTCSINKLVSATKFAPKTSLKAGLQAEIAWASTNKLL